MNTARHPSKQDWLKLPLSNLFARFWCAHRWMSGLPASCYIRCCLAEGPLGRATVKRRFCAMRSCSMPRQCLSRPSQRYQLRARSSSASKRLLTVLHACCRVSAFTCSTRPQRLTARQEEGVYTMRHRHESFYPTSSPGLVSDFETQSVAPDAVVCGVFITAEMGEHPNPHVQLAMHLLQLPCLEHKVMFMM